MMTEEHSRHSASVMGHTPCPTVGPILLDHPRDVDFVMGQTDSIAVMNDQLVVAGQVMGDSPKARQVGRKACYRFPSR
jgi:hypothetical protein